VASVGTEIVDKLVIDAIQILYPLQQTLHLHSELMRQILLSIQLQQNALSLFVLKPMSVSTQPRYLFDPHTLSLSILVSQLQYQQLKLLDLLPQGQH